MRQGFPETINITDRLCLQTETAYGSTTNRLFDYYGFFIGVAWSVNHQYGHRDFVYNRTPVTKEEFIDHISEYYPPLMTYILFHPELL